MSEQPTIAVSPSGPEGATNPAPPVLARETEILRHVQSKLRAWDGGPRQIDHGATMTGLRDSLGDQKMVDDIASIVEAMDRTAALMAQQEKADRSRVDPDNPYFGRMELDDDLGKRMVCIGKQTFLKEGVRIVDWRNAPISRLFYQYAEGDDYDEEINGRFVSGDVLVRRTMTIAEGELTRLTTDAHTWVRRADGQWLDMRAYEANLSGGAGAAVRPDSLGTHHSSGRNDKHLPEIASLLDPEQFGLITQRDSGIVVIQGSAGSGKTTVGLHRIAFLAFDNPHEFRPNRILVMVFSRALASYISKVLPALGVDGVRVETYPRWARWLLGMQFGRRLPERRSDETPALVTRFKTHTALLKMIDRLPQDRYYAGRDPIAVFEEIFTDRDWITKGLRRWASPEAFSANEIEKIWRWCTKQSHLRADGGGPNDHERPCLDEEDDTILLRLRQVLKGPLRLNQRRPLRYDHLMIDEAQDMSPLELAVLIGTADRKQNVTLAGDVAQKVMEHREFAGWFDVMEALNLGHVAISPLQVSYRSTRPIMQVARDILGHLAPEEAINAPRDGAPVAHLAFDSMGAAVTWLAPVLTDLMAREPTANVALLCATSEEAGEWYAVLERSEVHHLRWVDDQNFAFKPGIEVTDIRSSKGLEFDYVVCLGVDASAFPARDGARHLLHVGATRAAHQLWLVSTTQTPSPLIPAGLPGLLPA